MAATNKSKAAKTAYEKLMEGATKKEFLSAAAVTAPENTEGPAPVQAKAAPVVEAPKSNKVEPIVERATPAIMPLVVPTQAAGMSEGTVMVRMANGRVKPMSSGVALKMQNNYPNEFKIIQ